MPAPLETSSFAQRLQYLVDVQAGGVVSAFARKCEIGESTIRKYLADTTPGILTAVEIADKCEIDLLWLCSGRGDPLDGQATDRAREERAEYVVEGDFITIPYYDAKASAGLGIANGDDVEHKPFKFRRDWWMKHIGITPEQCFSMEIGGDSMAPRLTEAHLPILQWTEEMGYEGIYVFRLDGEVFIKNLERVPGRGLIARSENPKYTPWEIGDGSGFGEFKIIGRMLKKQTMQDP